MRRDFGKTLPPVGRRESPRDADVRPWAEAVEHETDPRTKLFVLLVLAYGWRPINQAARARWRWVQYDEAGKPLAFVTEDGSVEGFKSFSRIVAHIPPAVGDALDAWRKVCPRTDPEAYVFGGSAPLSREVYRGLWRRFARKWGLRPLTPVALRHWVKTTCRRLSDPALAALQGHQPPRDGSMRNVYDNPAVEAILDEQRVEFPQGPLAVLRPPAITVADGLEAELGAVKDWRQGLIGTVELIARLEALQRRAQRPPLLGP